MARDPILKVTRSSAPKHELNISPHTNTTRTLRETKSTENLTLFTEAKLGVDINATNSYRLLKANINLIGPVTLGYVRRHSVTRDGV